MHRIRRCRINKIDYSAWTQNLSPVIHANHSTQIGSIYVLSSDICSDNWSCSVVYFQCYYVKFIEVVLVYSDCWSEFFERGVVEV